MPEFFRIAVDHPHNEHVRFLEVRIIRRNSRTYYQWRRIQSIFWNSLNPSEIRRYLRFGFQDDSRYQAAVVLFLKSQGYLEHFPMEEPQYVTTFGDGGVVTWRGDSFPITEAGITESLAASRHYVRNIPGMSIHN